MCVQKVTPVSEVVSQYVTNKSFLVCVKSKKYAFLFTLRLLGFMKQGEAELPTLHYQVRQKRAMFIMPVTNGTLTTLDSLINVLHAYFFFRIFTHHHNLISLDIFFSLGLIHSKMLLMV